MQSSEKTGIQIIRFLLLRQCGSYPEFATIVITRLEGCPLLQGPFALTHSRALHKVLRAWGSCLTWTAQREHASQIVKGMQSFYDANAFARGWGREIGGGG